MLLPLVGLMPYVLPCCTTKEGNSHTVVLSNTRDIIAVCGLHRRSQDGSLEMLDSLHRMNSREGLRSSVLPEYPLCPGICKGRWVFMRVNTSRFVICNMIQHIPQGLEKGLKLLACTTVETFEDMEEHGKSHPKFHHQV